MLYFSPVVRSFRMRLQWLIVDANQLPHIVFNLNQELSMRPTFICVSLFSHSIRDSSVSFTHSLSVSSSSNACKCVCVVHDVCALFSVLRLICSLCVCIVFRGFFSLAPSLSLSFSFDEYEVRNIFHITSSLRSRVLPPCSVSRRCVFFLSSLLYY